MNRKVLEDESLAAESLAGSEGGVLQLKKGRISFETDTARKVFDAAMNEVSEIKFPWLYMGAGMILSIGEEKFRLSFIRPGNTSGGEYASISDARATGKIWRAALLATDENSDEN